MGNESEKNENTITKKLIEVGADIAGSASSAAIGFLVAGPPGAFAGAVSGPAITHTIKHVASEIKSRFLSKREEKRIGATLAYAITKIEENLKKGKKVRDDGFFESKTTERPPSQEIYEGTLIAAQKEHEEKKIKYYGNLLANLGFEKSFDKAQANLLLKIGQELTYRQLCILSLIPQKERFTLRQLDYRGQDVSDGKLIVLLQEIYDLYNQGLVNGGTDAYISLTDVNPSKIGIQGTGVYLYNLMELFTIPKEELDPVAIILG
jgi:hypothetical protein